MYDHITLLGVFIILVGLLLARRNRSRRPRHMYDCDPMQRVTAISMNSASGLRQLSPIGRSGNR